MLPLTPTLSLNGEGADRANFFVGIPLPTGEGIKRPHKKQSPVSRALHNVSKSIVGVQRPLAECRAHAVVFGKLHNSHHIIFNKTCHCIA